MKKILLLLTFIIACNVAPQCHTRPIFTGKDNPVPVFICAAALAAAGIGVYSIYLFIYDKFFGVNNGNVNIKFGNINGSTIKNIGNSNDSTCNKLNNSSDGLFSRIINFVTGKAQGNDWNFIKGNKIKETKTIILEKNFENIIASDKGNLNIHKSPNDTNTLETTADNNILEYLKSTFNNNTYTIEIKPPTCTSIEPTTPVEYNLYLNPITLANLKSFEADNYLKATLSNHITSNQFKLCAKNYAEISAIFKSLDQLSINGENYAEINATGTEINTLSINSQNKAKIKAMGTKIETLSINSHNSAEIEATGTTINALSIKSENHDNITVNGQIESTTAILSNRTKATVNTKNLSYNITNYASLTHNRSANITKQKCSNSAQAKTY